MRIPVKTSCTVPQVYGSIKQVATINGTIAEIDAVRLVKALPSESIGLVICDPAYESLEKWRSTGTTTRLKESKGSSNKWFQTFPNERYWELFQEMYRVLKKGTHLYMFCDEETRDLVTTGYSPQTGRWIAGYDHVDPPSPILRAGFKYWKSIVWDKILAGMGYHYRAQHEFIIMAEKVESKGKHRRLNDARPGDVIQERMLKGSGFYPTEKPYNLIKLLIEQSSNPGDVVLDPMCGGGVVGQVCRATKRQYLLGDLDIAEVVKRLS